MAKVGSQNVKMTEGPLLSSIIKYSIPIIIGGIIQILFNAADLAVVGNFSQSKTLAGAAVGATGSFVSLVVNLFMGISVGVNIILARSLGNGDKEKSHRIVHTAMPLALILGIIVAVIGTSLARWAMEIMKCPEDSMQMAIDYMIIYFLGAPGILVYNFGAAILRTKGDTKRPLYFLIVAGVLNVILNFIFVVFFKMEAAGVALSTSLTQALAAVLVVISLTKQDDETRYIIKKSRLYLKEAFEIIRYGLPTGLTNAMFSIANLQISSAVNEYGNSAINGSAAVAQLEGYMQAGTSAFNASAVAFIGQNIGAGNRDRVKKSFIYSMLCCVVFTLVVGYGIYFAGEPLIRFFNASDPAVVTWGMERMAVMMRIYFLYGFSSTLNGALQGFGYSNAVMINSIVSICGLRTLYMQYWYPTHKTFTWLFTCYPISMITINVIDAVILIFVFNTYMKKGKVA